MGKQVKGCMTTGCVANNNKFKYSIADHNCKKCGNPLVIVCKKCYTPLPENYKKDTCERCLAEKADKKDRGKKKAGKVVLGLGGLAILGKTTWEIVKAVKNTVI